MPSKNSISGLLKSGGGDKSAILPKTGKLESGSREKRASTSPAPRASKIGRPKKKRAEKRDFKITLSLTQEEGERIIEKSGLADKATFLYDFLQKQGAFK